MDKDLRRILLLAGVQQEASDKPSEMITESRTRPRTRKASTISASDKLEQSLLEHYDRELRKFKKLYSAGLFEDKNSRAQGILKDDLEDDVEAVDGSPEENSGKQAAGDFKKEGAKKLIDTPDFKVIIPTTNKRGDVYIIYANINGKQRKFQLHYESNQFKNEYGYKISKRDIASLSRIPQYTDFLNRLIEKHYGEYFQ